MGWVYPEILGEAKSLLHTVLWWNQNQKSNYCGSLEDALLPPPHLNECIIIFFTTVCLLYDSQTACIVHVLSRIQAYTNYLYICPILAVLIIIYVYLSKTLWRFRDIILGWLTHIQPERFNKYFQIIRALTKCHGKNRIRKRRSDKTARAANPFHQCIFLKSKSFFMLIHTAN